MKYASSIRYAGDLVDAAECDYQDYDYLKLLCPECKDPVFLRGASSRIVNGKNVSVGACFCHFPGKDPSLIAECENRVSRYTPKQLRCMAAQARGQRLKAIQRWTWTVIENHYLSFYERLISSECQPDKNVLDMGAETFIDLWRSQRNAPHLFDKFLDDMWEGNSTHIVITDEIRSLPCMINRAMFERIKKLKKLDLRMHKKIVKEVLDYLATPSAQPVLQSLFSQEVHGVIDALVGEYLHPDGLNFSVVNGSFASSKLGWLRVSLTAINGMYSVLLTIPWAEEFAKLQKTETAKGLESTKTLIHQ